MQQQTKHLVGQDSSGHRYPLHAVPKSATYMGHHIKEVPFALVKMGVGGDIEYQLGFR